MKSGELHHATTEEVDDSLRPEAYDEDDIIIVDSNDENFFSEESSKERMKKYLDSINPDDFLAVIRGYRKHLDYFQKKLSDVHYKEKYEDNPDLLNLYAISNLVRDYLCSVLDIPSSAIALDVKMRKEGAPFGHYDFENKIVQINFDYSLNGTLGDIVHTMAHEMWHAKQACSIIEKEECDVENNKLTIIRTPYYNALMEQIDESTDHSGYWNQAIEKEARDFSDEFMEKISSTGNPVYEAWMYEKYGLPANYYGQISADLHYQDEYGDYDAYDDWDGDGWGDE